MGIKLYEKTDVVADHLDKLQAARIDMADIARQTGIGKSTLYNIRRRTDRVVRGDYARRILKVTTGEPGHLRSPDRARDMLRALARMGYGVDTLGAVESLPNHTHISRLRRGDVHGISQDVEDRITKYYHSHKRKQGPDKLTATRARQNGWLTPQELDKPRKTRG